MMNNKKLIIFDWGNTVMRDLQMEGPMKNWSSVEWIPGVHDALKFLSSKYTLCIATSAEHSDTQDMAEALARVGAEEYFHFFYSSFDLKTRKPDPEFFRQILINTGFEPGHAVSIGDKYVNDIEPAKELGIKTIFFNEKNIAGSFPAADHIITHMNSLVDAIENIGQSE